MEMISDTRTKRCLGTPSEPGQQQAVRVSCMDMMAEHQSHLLQQLDEQRRQELFCDCHVLVDGQLFKAHRNVLFSSSGYFRMLLAHSVAEFGQPVSASFEAFSADTFSIILDFIYSGRLNLTSTNVIEVMSAASYLQMNDVIGFCKGFIRSSLDISAKDADDQCLNLPEESIIPPVSSHVPIPQVMFCEDSKPEVSTLRRSPGTPPSRGRRRGSAAQSVKVEHLTESTGYRGRGRRRAWSALSRAESASITDLQGAASTKAQKADDLYASLPTIVGVVGVFNKDSSPTMRFKCPFCTHTVKRKADLKRHLRCHTGERPYPCEACSKRFTRLEHLRSHFETIHQARKLVCRKCKRHVTELSGQVVCEGTRRYRLCNECIQESGCDNLVIDNSATSNNEPGLLLGVDGVEEEEDKEKDWIMTDEDDLAVDSGTDLIIQEVDDSEEEQELQN